MNNLFKTKFDAAVIVLIPACIGINYLGKLFANPQKAMQFGNATSSVKNTVPGDLPSSDFKEIDRIIREHNATGPVSEMNR